MKNILIAISLEDELLIPLKRLKNEISLKNTNIHLLHVVKKEIMSVEMATYEWPNNDEFKEMKKSALNKMEHMKTHIIGDSQPQSVTIDIILDLSPKDTIIEEAKKFKANMIVVSTRGKKGFEGLFSNSMAEYLIKYSPCDLLVLRPN